MPRSTEEKIQDIAIAMMAVEIYKYRNEQKDPTQDDAARIINEFYSEASNLLLDKTLEKHGYEDTYSEDERDVGC